jgi:Flp pilus assembly protein TadD
MRRFLFLILCVFLAGSLYAAGSSGGSGGGMSNNGSTQQSALDLYNQGYALANAGKYRDAAGDFQQAINLKGDYAEAYNMLGYCTRKMGNVSGAFAYYEKALQLKPNFPEAREYYGEAYLQDGNLAKAVQQYIILEKAGSKNAGELLEKIGDFVNKKS